MRTCAQKSHWCAPVRKKVYSFCIILRIIAKHYTDCSDMATYQLNIARGEGASAERS